MSWLLNSSYSLSVETEAYIRINKYGIRPKFLAHLTENNDCVIGYNIEGVAGRATTVGDLPPCRAVLSKLLMAGYLLGRDSTPSSFRIQDSRRALIADLGSCERYKVDNN